MNGLAPSVPRLELLLARLLRTGTWAGCAVIGVGLAAQALGAGALGRPVALLGIGLVIALPVLRVAAMLAYFLRVRDIRFGAVSLLVLTIIFAGIAISV